MHRRRRKRVRKKKFQLSFYYSLWVDVSLTRDWKFARKTECELKRKADRPMYRRMQREREKKKYWKNQMERKVTQSEAADAFFSLLHSFHSVLWNLLSFSRLPSLFDRRYFFLLLSLLTQQIEAANFPLNPLDWLGGSHAFRFPSFILSCTFAFFLSLFLLLLRLLSISIHPICFTSAKYTFLRHFACLL